MSGREQLHHEKDHEEWMKKPCGSEAEERVHLVHELGVKRVTSLYELVYRKVSTKFDSMLKCICKILGLCTKE